MARLRLASLDMKRDWHRDHDIPKDLWDYLDYLESQVKDYHTITRMAAEKLSGAVPEIGERYGKEDTL